MSTEDPPSGGDHRHSAATQPSLDSSCDNRTRWEERLSGSNAPDEETADEPEPSDWNRQQSRVFHRVMTLLLYWESRGYEIVWVTLTSCPESDDADQLMYNVQRLRQTIERARYAVGKDGDGHRLTHINELEQLAIRTNEGPEGKGVVHLFWAWKPPEGQHSRSLYIPQDWLARQWARIHGPHDEHSEEPAGRLWVSIEKYGAADYHDRKHVARYCVTQYLGEHGEALEHVSWSHGRTLGGSLTETWRAVRAETDSLEAAVNVWEEVIAGESVPLVKLGANISYSLLVHPPPNLRVEREGLKITPPEGYCPSGTDSTTLRTVQRSRPEYDGTDCPECGRGGVFELGESFRGDLNPDAHPEWVRAYCVVCHSRIAEPGEGDREVVERELPPWEGDDGPAYRQTALWEFGVEKCVTPAEKRARRRGRTGAEPRRGPTELIRMSRERESEPEPEPEQATGPSLEAQVRRLGDDVTVPQAMGRLGLPPSERSRVEQVVERVG